MNKQQLVSEIESKKSFLCIGLDSDPEKIPSYLLSLPDPVFEFNKQIIDATHDLCVAYKPNTAFYEVLGAKGWRTLEKTVKYIRKKNRNLFIIADAKRGDIGNTSSMYAKAFFNTMDFDAVTVAPYMGSDSVIPFLNFKNKWIILLALTSNGGADDFQKIQVFDKGSKKINQAVLALFEKVINTSKQWGNSENMMYVVGATQAKSLKDIRKILPNHFLLIPGVGAQGGSFKEVVKYGMNEECGLLVNSSRNIIYASSKKDFAKAARNEALKVQTEMAAYL